MSLLPPTEGTGTRLQGRMHRDGAALVLQWDPQEWGDGAVRQDSLRMRAPETDALHALVRAVIDAPHESERCAATARMLEWLRAWGLPLRRGIDPSIGAAIDSPQDAALVRVVDHALGCIGTNPTTQDLSESLGLSPGHAQRLLARVPCCGERLGWRELKRRFRLYFGATLMTSRGATTEAVAKALGYSSPTVFCRAMAEAGLPSPAAVRDRVVRLA